MIALGKKPKCKFYMYSIVIEKKGKKKGKKCLAITLADHTRAVNLMMIIIVNVNVQV